ncbi:metal ABC transporter solute-binding protein, Zn/Mn family, partial [Caldithrix abyssi]
MKIYLSLFSAIVLFLFLGCGGQKDSTRNFSKHKIKIITTTGMIADAAKNVGGERVSVTPLMGPGVDPHLYKASEGDVSRMA